MMKSADGLTLAAIAHPRSARIAIFKPSIAATRKHRSRKAAKPRKACAVFGKLCEAAPTLSRYDWLMPTQPVADSRPRQEDPLSRRVAVLGGGITGLSAAWHLQRAGYAPTVFEKSSRVGGAIGAIHGDDWLHETGPNSLLEGSPTVAGLIDDVGLGPRRMYAAAEARNRYVVRGGRLIPMPASPFAFLSTPLFSLRAKCALLGEPWRPRGSANAEESVADFVLRRLGREFLEYAVDPFVGGVYAGDPAQLSVRHAFPKLHALEQQHGSLIRGAIKRRNARGGPKGRIFSFPRGLEELPHAIAAKLGSAVHLRTTVRNIRRHDSGWEIAFETDGVSATGQFAAIVCALPADAMAALRIEGVAGTDRIGMLREIEQPPVASVFTVFRHEDIVHPLDGFGMLIPRIEQRRILGSLFSSTLFPGRAPAGHVALTTFVGGTRQPRLAQLDDQELWRLVTSELSQLIGLRRTPVFTNIRRCPRAIPQYTIGFQCFKDLIAEVEAAAPGLFIGGNCRDGISLSNCIESGHRLAGNVATFLARQTGHPAPAATLV
jgi:oxygen-dependent protoporphyrinogen oxidase